MDRNCGHYLTILVTEAIRIIVGTGFNERTHTQPNHLEAYGLHFPVAKKGRMKKKKEMKKEKAKFRDTRVWLDENHSLSFYSLQDGVRGHHSSTKLPLGGARYCR